ncbi:hypothetical protein A4A49_63421, partial [Nicotiana attenuata]
MASLKVLIRHSGKWNNENFYIDYSKKLGIDLSSKSIKIEYKMERNCTPMEIHNDMSYRVYVELKKENGEFGMYPLGITTLDKEIVDGGSLFQRDLMQLDATDGVNKFDTVDTLALASLNSGEPIEVFE